MGASEYYLFSFKSFNINKIYPYKFISGPDGR